MGGDDDASNELPVTIAISWANRLRRNSRSVT